MGADGVKAAGMCLTPGSPGSMSARSMVSPWWIGVSLMAGVSLIGTGRPRSGRHPVRRPGPPLRRWRF